MLIKSVVLHKSIYIVSFLFAFFSVYAQHDNIQLYNTDNGLPQNSVKDIIKDRHGFIWLTTENGIVRYDGLNFLVYKNFPLNSQRFTYFYGYPEKDSLYTTGDYGNTILIHRRSASVLDKIKKSPTLIVKDNINYYLYASNYSYSPSPGVCFFMNFKKGRYYMTENSFLYQDYHSKTRISLKVKPLHKYNPSSFAMNEFLFYIDYQLKKVRKIEEGIITDSYSIPLLTDSRSKIFWSRINGQVFILNNDTIYSCIYSHGKLEITKLAQSDHIRDSTLISVYYDKEYKKLYLGSGTDGLKIINLPDFFSSKRNSPKASSVFYSIQPYNDSSVITPAGEIYDRNGFVKSKNFKKATSYFLDYDKEGNIMTRKEQTLLIYKKESAYQKVINFSTGENTLNDFFFDGSLYYTLSVKHKITDTGYNGVLEIYEDWPYKSLKKKYLFANVPTICKLTDEGDILVGTIKGLYKISPQFNTIYNLTGKSELSIRDIIRTKDGNFWITTLGRGLYLLKNNRLLKMPDDGDGNLSSAHTLLEDKNGFFWISTNNGLYKIREELLLKYAQNHDFKPHYYKFLKEGGFTTNEFNGGSNINGNRLGNGEFVLPSLNGLVFFDPLKIKSYYPKNIFIERALVDDKEVFFTNNLRLDREARWVDIFIDVPYYSNPDNIIIMARLDNDAEGKWVSIGKDRKYSVNNLGYGAHSLTVRMLISDREEFIDKKINIIIPPYFYQTLWFKILGFLFLLLLLYLSVKWRIGFHQKKNHELEEVIQSRTKILTDTVESLEITKIKLRKEIEQQKKLIGTITHDITTPIKFIALTAKEVLEIKDPDALRTEKILYSIYKSSNQLYNFTMTLKEYADIYSHYRSDEAELYSLYELIEEKKVLFDEIAANSNTVIINSIDKAVVIRISKNILAAIIHNLLDNAVKYTQNGTIIISCSTEDHDIILHITDTGVGMDEQKIEYYTKLQDNIENEKLLLQKYGMGLHLILQLLQMIESKIIIEKNEIKGTSFRLILKNKKDD